MRLIRPDKIIVDPIAWAKKYLIEASISQASLLPKRRGIKDNRLSSILIQIIIILLDERIIVIDNRREERKSIYEGLVWIIKEGAVALDEVRSFILPSLFSSLKRALISFMEKAKDKDG